MGSAALMFLLSGCAAATGRGNMAQMFQSKDLTAIGCAKHGSGPPVVLIHGTAADHARWAPVLPALEGRFTVYACDRRGRGMSGDAEAYSIEREFEDIAAVVDGIGGPVDLIGHSYGGICSLEGAQLSSNLRKLVLYEPPIPSGVPIYPPGIDERLSALLEAGDREGAVITFLTELPRVPPEQLAKLKASPAWHGRVAAAHTIVRELRAHQAYSFDPERLRGMQKPTLLL